MVPDRKWPAAGCRDGKYTVAAERIIECPIGVETVQSYLRRREKIAGIDRHQDLAIGLDHHLSERSSIGLLKAGNKESPVKCRVERARCRQRKSRSEQKNCGQQE